MNQDISDGDKYGTELSGLLSQHINDDLAVSIGFSLRDDVQMSEEVNAGDLLSNQSWATDWNADGVYDEIAGPSAVVTTKKKNTDQSSVFAALGWQVNDKLTITADYLSGTYEYTQDLAVMSAWGMASPINGNTFNRQLVDPTKVDINDEGYIMSGLAEVGSIGKWDADVINKDETDAFGINFDYQISDDIRFEVDISRSTADRKYQWRSMSGEFAPGMNHYYAFDRNGGGYSIDYLGSEARPATINDGAFDLSTYTLDQSQLTNVANDASLYNFWGVSSTTNTTDAQLDAIKADLTFDVDLGMFHQIKTGFRLVEHDVEVGKNEEYYGADILAPVDFESLNSSITGNGFQKLDVTGYDEHVYFDPGTILNANKGTLPEDTLTNNDMLKGFKNKEETTAAYIQGNFAGDWYDGTIGVRYYKTELEAIGHAADFYLEEGPWGSLDIKIGDEVLPVTEKNDYSGILPTLNVNLRVIDDTVIRLGAGKAMMRPTTHTIGPNVDIKGKRIWGDQPTKLSQKTLGSQGNPSLDAIESTQFDVSFEWYPTQWDYYSIAVFHKNLDQLHTQGADYIPVEGAFTPEGEPIALPMLSEIESEGGTLTGWEFSFRQDLGGFTSYLKGLALSGNYMALDHGAQQDYNPKAPEESEFHEILYAPVQWIDSTYNVALTYDLGKSFSTRLNLTQQDYLALRDGGEGFKVNQPTKNLSLSVNYKIFDNFTIFAQASNLLDEDQVSGNLKSDKVNEAHPDFLRKTIASGISWYAGIRGNF
jgi:TonB-dependent receptor